MSGSDKPLTNLEQLREATRWLAIAVEDARVARSCLQMASPALGVAAYHCQQAAEKLLKGLLIAAGAGFPRTHDLTQFAGQAARRYPDLRSSCEAMAPLTVWSVAYRYPSAEEYDEPDPTADALQ
jgi:HEPN domain-containing protein